MLCMNLLHIPVTYIPQIKVNKTEVSAHQNEEYFDLNISNLKPVINFSLTLNHLAVC